MADSTTTPVTASGQTIPPSPTSRPNRRRQLILLALTAGALLIGTLNGGGHLLARRALTTEGRGYYPYALTYQFDNTNSTGPRLREVLDGHWLVSDYSLYEKTGTLFYWPPLPPLLFLPLTIFTRSIVNLIILGDFVFPAIIFLLFFFLYRALDTRRRFSPAFCFALISSLYVYFSLHLPPLSSSNLKAFLKSALPFDLVGAPDPYLFSRRKEAFVPALLPLLLTFIFGYLAAVKEKKRYAVAAGFFLAASGYSYPYHFVYAATSLGLLFLYALGRRQKILLRQLLIVGASAAVFLLPLALNQIRLLNLPYYGEFAERNGLEIGRAFRSDHWPRYAWLITVAVFIYLRSRRTSEEGGQTRGAFVAAPLLAGIIDWNLQVIFGFTVQSDHWLDREIFFGLDLAYFVLFLWLWDWLATRPATGLARRYRLRAAAISLLAIFLLSLTATQVRALFANARANYWRATIPPDLSRALSWLDTHTPTDAVVMTPSLVSNMFLTLYTGDKIFVPHGLGTLASEDEVLERLFITYSLFGLDKNYLEQALTPLRKDENTYDAFERSAIGYLFAARYQSRALTEWTRHTGVVRPLPVERYETIIERFRTFRCDNCLKKYRVDYLLYGPNEKKIAHRDFSHEPFLRQVYDDGSTQIFAVEQH